MNTSKGQVYSEELRGQLSEALPNAVGIFAQALYGNDPDGEKKLFKAMERGEVRMEELVKVIDYMKTLSREDLIAKVMDSPARKMTAMRTAWQRLLTEINSSFMLDVFTSIFDAMAVGLQDITKWMKENKETIDSWVKGVKIAGKVLWELVPALLAIWGLRKVFNILGLFQGVAARTLITRLLTGNMGALWLTMLFGAGGAGGLGARIGAGLVTAMKIARFTVIAAIPVLIAGIADDIYTAMIGGDSLIGTATQSDNPFSKWISRSILGAFEVGKAAFVSLFALFDLVFISHDWGMFTGVLKENFGELGTWLQVHFGELWGGIGETIRESIQGVFDWFNSVLGLMGANLALFGKSLKQMVMLDFEGAAASRAAMKDIGSLDQIKSMPLQMPINASPYSTANPSFLLPRNNQPTLAPNLSLVLNVQGTPDDVVKMANESFTTLLQSTLLGTMANHQGGK